MIINTTSKNTNTLNNLKYKTMISSSFTDIFGLCESFYKGGSHTHTLFFIYQPIMTTTILWL